MTDTQHLLCDQQIEDLKAFEREKVNREWLEALSSRGLIRPSSITPSAAVLDIRQLMLKEFSNRLKDRRKLLDHYQITDAPAPTKPIFRFGAS